jgi:hypothetical protein
VTEYSYLKNFRLRELFLVMITVPFEDEVCHKFDTWESFLGLVVVSLEVPGSGALSLKHGDT